MAANTPNNDTSKWASRISFGRSLPGGHVNDISATNLPLPAHSAPQGDSDQLCGGFSNTSPSVSPRIPYRQPVRRSNGYHSFGDYVGSTPGVAPSPSHHPHVPPLPHRPQAHYYGVPDLELPSLSHDEGSTARDKAWRAFDTLASAGDASTTSADNVLLMALDNGIQVCKIDRNKCHLVGQLLGLRGNVIGAKILPCTSLRDPLNILRPLIALIVHGPASVHSHDQILGKTNHSFDAEFDPSDSILQAMEHVDDVVSQPVTHCQTTVDVYSLKTQEFITTLFRSPMVEVVKSRRDRTSKIPQPIGNLSIKAEGRFVTVCSGDSGEIYLFEAARFRQENVRESFKCLGKTWTSIPIRKSRSWSASSASSEREISQDTSPVRIIRSEIPTFSLSRRWLAIVPPRPSSRSTIHGIVDVVSPKSNPPGLNTHTAPSQPPVNCELDNPVGDSTLNRIARDVTQEVIRGARWVGDQGIQALKSYWYKPQDLSSHTKHQHTQSAPVHETGFPPTHAHDDRATKATHQPVLVSILDLEKLSKNQDSKPGIALSPIATFSLPGGCSFLSFAPSGLNLLTASAKGDVQYIWDLMRLMYGKSTTVTLTDGLTGDQSPSIRQVAQFTRLTIANIIDVAWIEPKGDRLGIVTERGTVHIFDLPQLAFQWPPSRRLARPVISPGQPSGESSELSTVDSPASSGSALSNAISMVNGRTQPFFAAVRGRPPSIGNAINGLGGFNITAGAGAKGSKVVAAGISKSVGAATGTVNTLRHLGENRLHMPGSLNMITPGNVRWLTGRDRNSIAVMGGDLLRIHNVKQSINTNPGKRRPSVFGAKPVEITLPDVLSERSSMFVDGATADGVDVRSPHGYWPNPTTILPHHRPRSAHPLSYAEIETNAPYQPFHTDRRVGLHIYDDAEMGIHHLHDDSPWVFGQEIPTIEISAGTTESFSRSREGDETDTLQGQIENLISLSGNEQQGQQVVVTTRRKRGKKGKIDARDEEDFFEEDCEVVDFAEDRV